jgi:hypothetical protein
VKDDYPRLSVWILLGIVVYALAGWWFREVTYYNWLTTLLWLASCFVFGAILGNVQWIIWRRRKERSGRW